MAALTQPQPDRAVAATLHSLAARQLLRLATAPITRYRTPLTSAQRNMITMQNGGYARE
jgi:hypothetical protein